MRQRKANWRVVACVCAAALFLPQGLFAAEKADRKTKRAAEAVMKEKLTAAAAENIAALGIARELQSDAELFASDPEFMSNMYNFAYGEVLSESGIQIDPRSRHLAILAAVLGAQGVDEFEVALTAALNDGVTPVEAKEVVYQAAAYLGFAKVRPFLSAANDVLEARGVKLPLEDQGTTTQENRRQKGNQVQIDVFGERLRESWRTGPEERAAVNSFLASNCFGDYYTRGGLDIKDRELVTFCYLIAQGGCDPQATSHAAGNMSVGNSRDFLIDVVSNLVPYIGYPRSLNALTCIDNASRQ